MYFNKSASNCLFSIVFMLVFLTGCTNHKPATNLLPVELNDSVKYISVNDASSIDSAWRADNVVVYQVMAEPDNLHPTNGISAMRAELNYYLHKTLLQTDYRTLSTIPALVKAMPEVSADYLQYVFELTDAPRWDNGDPVIVDDIIFTCKANKCVLVNNPNAKPYWDNVEAIMPDTANSRRFTVIMKRPYIQSLGFWCDYPVLQQQFYDREHVLKNYSFKQLSGLEVLPADSLKIARWAAEFNNLDSRNPSNINGLGAYQLQKWVDGQEIILTKKKNHWTSASESIYNKALPEQIIFKLIKDPVAQLLEFKAGNLDASTTMNNKSLVELQQDSMFNQNYHSAFVSTFNYTYAAFNCKPDGSKHKKLFVDPNVRRALALLTPVDEINRVMNYGKNKRIAGPVSPLKEEFNRKLMLLPFDPEQEADILGDAGWKDGNNDGVREKIIDGVSTDFKFDLMYYTNAPDWKDYAEMMSAAFEKVGIIATPVGYDPGTAQQKMFSHDFDMIIGSWGGSSAPEDYTQLWSTSEWANGGANFTGFGNARSDSLIQMLSTTMDRNKRIELSHQLQQIIYDDQPYVFLTAGLRRVVVHKRFGNCEFYFERPNLLMNNLKLLRTNNGS